MATVQRSTFCWRNDASTKTPSLRSSWALIPHVSIKHNASNFLHSIFYSLPYLCYTIDVRDGGMIAVVTVRCLTVSFMGRANYP